MELLVVVLIVALLTSIVAPRLLGQVARTEVTTTQAQLSTLTKALHAYRLDMGQYPTTSEGLSALMTVSQDPRWRGPYLQGSIPQDAWNTAFQYAGPTAEHTDYSLFSFGRDRKQGGEGDDADIYAR